MPGAPRITLERGASEMARDWQPKIRIAVEILFPTWLCWAAR